MRRAPREVACGEEADDRLGAGWGLALAPAGFGTFGTGLLAGTFGDRRISAFGPATGAFPGQLRDPSGHLAPINGLRGLAFGNGGLVVGTTTLFFAVGLNNEADDLSGTLRPAEHRGRGGVGMQLHRPGNSRWCWPRARATGGMMTHPNRQAVRAAVMLAAAGVLAIGLAAGSAAPAVAGPGAAASHTASFQALGQMPGAIATDVDGISGDGSTIAGYGTICTSGVGGTCTSSNSVQAFRWTPAGGYQVLGSPGGSDFFGAGAVSLDGSVIVGEHPRPNQFAAFRWTAATGMVQLPINIAAAVTPDGQMVAGGDNWWKTTGQTGTFGPFPGFQDQTEVQGLAGTAQAPVAVGAAIKGSDTFGPTFHAFRWTPATGLADLGVLPGGDQSIAIAISADEKVVVGEAQVSGLWHAFRWTAATGMTDLGTLSGGAESAAFAVNSDGSVIVGSSGTSQSTGSDHAFRWTAKTGMQDLQTMLKPPHDLILQSAIGVSQDGTVITGNGFNTRLGADEPWRAVLPLP